MSTVTSADGTVIDYDRYGDGRWRPRSGVNGSGRRLLGEITRRP
jgi:hypothetical protein